MERITRVSLLDQLETEGYLSREQCREAQAHLASSNTMEEQPWFIKALQGFGGWLASLTVLLGVSLILSGDEDAALVLGAISLLTGTAFERRQTRSAFMSQICLSAILVGLGLTLWGLSSYLDGFIPAVMAAALICAALCRLVRGWVIRCLTALGAAASVAVLLVTQMDSLLPLSVLLAAGAGLLVTPMEHELTIRRRLRGFYGPLRAALVISVLSGIAAGTAMRTSDVSHDWLEVWILSTALAALLLLALRKVLIDLGHPPNSRGSMSILGLALIISVCLAASPGALAALLLLILSLRGGDRWTAGVSTIALIGFGANFYYVLELSLLFKAFLLVLAGGLMLYAGTRLSLESAA